VLAAGACSDPAPATRDPRTSAASSIDAHQHHAPHGGMLIELGGELAHVELVFDREAGALTAYVLDGEAEAPRRVAQATLPIVLDAPSSLAGRPLELHAVESALTGERVGDASEFTWRDPRLKGLVSIRGQILEISVDGQTFREIRFPPVRTSQNPEP
jgi:hypothetical protein